MLKIFSPRFVPLYPVLGLLGACAQAVNYVPQCNSSVYCNGELLRTVQLARIFPDSKTFVDLKLKCTEQEVLVGFEKFMAESHNKPSRKQILSFLDKYFEEKDDLLTWRPPDFDPTPPVLDQIVDPQLRQFAKDVIGMWPVLGRRVTPDAFQNSDQYSIVNVPNGFIVPGGRFKELYYWDTYWIIKGLLISNMVQTARGIIENFIHLVNKFGYIPNGGRIYYLGRSQPPMLTWMVSEYVSATGDLSWLKSNIATIEKEVQFWLDKKKAVLEVNGKKYMLLRYFSDKDDLGPRPESYYEDYASSRTIPKELRERFYLEMKSAAESGWDFSSRWFVAAGNDSKFNLTDLNTSQILPVDLNSIFAGALQKAGDFRHLLNDNRAANKWWSLAKYWRNAIANVMWNAEDGTWYDYHMGLKRHKKYFYPSCAAPFWAGAVEPADKSKYAAPFIKYLQNSTALDFPGGIPTSLWHTGEQWDFPNAWPPLQSMVIGALEQSGHEEAKNLARKQVEVWIRANYLGYKKWQKMFEKYSCVNPGEHGGGGEYAVQAGFGWTNGIVLELLQNYGKVLSLVKGHDGLPSVLMVK